MTNKTLILAGIIGRFPVGGVTWCFLHYIAGFQRLGYSVFYLEDTGECGYDPVANRISDDPSYAVNYIHRQLKMVGLENSWAYIDHHNRYHGKSPQQVREVCRETELLVNVSGGCWFARPEYDSLTKIFIDTDPGFHQLNIAEGRLLNKNWTGYGSHKEFFSAYDKLFTFALNIGSPTCRLAETPFHWHPTIQPLALEFWPVMPPPPQAPYTAILSWRIDSFSGIGKGKSSEMLKMIDLPGKCPHRILVAIAGQPPFDLLRQHGWELTDAVAETIDPFVYRSFIQHSKAEIGFAKAMYIETQGGWFSDRTECYLATGRPALVRDTGFREILPCSEGLLTYSDEQGILDGMEHIERNYAHHCRTAREFAEEYFDADKVLRKLLHAV
jgi:hypothetical protein